MKYWNKSDQKQKVSGFMIETKSISKHMKTKGFGRSIDILNCQDENTPTRTHACINKS